MDFKLKNIETVLHVSKIANVHFFEFPKKYETKENKHPFCELIFVNSGFLHVRSDEYNGLLTKNQMLIHGNNCAHALSCPHNIDPSVIIIGFECFSDRLNSFGKKPIALNESEIRQLSEIVKEGRNVFSPPYDVPVYDMKKKKNQIFGCEQILQRCLEVFLIQLIRKYEFFESNEEIQRDNFEINEIVEYVDNNFLEKITIDELAFLFQTNRSTLCKEFKEATGKTLIQYISNKKLEQAKNKLLAANKTIAQIADELNFDCVPYFCRFFKKNTGITPKEYQNLHT